MADPVDMIIPMLRDSRAEMTSRFDGVEAKLEIADRRFRSLEATVASFKQALSADSLLSRLVPGAFEGRIEDLERRVRDLESHR